MTASHHDVRDYQSSSTVSDGEYEHIATSDANTSPSTGKPSLSMDKMMAKMLDNAPLEMSLEEAAEEKDEEKQKIEEQKNETAHTRESRQETLVARANVQMLYFLYKAFAACQSINTCGIPDIPGNNKNALHAKAKNAQLAPQPDQLFSFCHAILAGLAKTEWDCDYLRFNDEASQAHASLISRMVAGYVVAVIGLTEEEVACLTNSDGITSEAEGLAFIVSYGLLSPLHYTGVIKF